MAIQNKMAWKAALICCLIQLSSVPALGQEGVAPEPTPESAPVPQGEPTPQPAPVPQGQPTPEPAPVPQGHPTPEPAPVPQGEPTPEPAPVPQVEPTPQPAPVPQGQPTPQPAPVPQGEPTPQPAPVPQGQPTIVPAPVPQGEPTPDSSVAPQPGPSPPVEGGAGNDPCSGVAYVGYLSNCIIYIDLDSDIERDSSEPFDTSSNGTFSFAAPSLDLSGRILRLEPAAASKVNPVSPGSSICHDMATLLPERLPLASASPTTCSSESIIAVSPLSTLVAMGTTSDDISTALSIPTGYHFGSVDILRCALDGNSTCLTILKKEVQVRSLVSQITQAVSSNDAAFQKVALACFQTLASMISPPTTAQVSTTHNILTPDASFFQVLSSSSGITGADIQELDESIQTAIMASVSAFHELSEEQTPTIDDIFKSSLIVQRDIIPSIQQLVNGTITSESYTSSTTIDNMIRSLRETSLPEGSIKDPTASPPSSSDQATDSSLALPLGLGLGLGIPVLMLLIYGAFKWVQNKRKKKISHSRKQSDPPHEISASTA